MRDTIIKLQDEIRARLQATTLGDKASQGLEDALDDLDVILEEIDTFNTLEARQSEEDDSLMSSREREALRNWDNGRKL